MRWEYREPEKKTFVSDGKTFYFYVPADRQVIVREQAGLARHPGPAAVRAGRDPDPVRRWPRRTRRPPASGGCGSSRAKPDPEIEHVLLDVDAAARIRGIAVVDAQGNRSHFAFDGFKENVGLDDALFRFEVPTGVEVVTG